MHSKPLTRRTEPFQPNWKLIDDSPVWQLHVVPWLMCERDAIIEEMKRADTLVAYSRLAGALKALDDILVAPASRLLHAEQEAEQMALHSEEEEALYGTGRVPPSANRAGFWRSILPHR